MVVFLENAGLEAVVLEGVTANESTLANSERAWREVSLLSAGLSKRCSTGGEDGVFDMIEAVEDGRRLGAARDDRV